MTIVLTDMRDRAIRALHLKKIAETSAGQPPPDPPVSATGTDDPLFVAVEKLLRSTTKDPQQREPLIHKDGRFGSQLTVILGKVVPLTPEEMRLAAVYGILERDSEINPHADRFGEAVKRALAEYTVSDKLFRDVFGILTKAGETPVFAPVETELAADNWVAVARILQHKGISPDDGNLYELAVGLLVDLRVTDGGLTQSTIRIDLPALEDQTAIEIVAPNLQAMQAIYFAAMLDNLKVFQVADKLVEFFFRGVLPLGRGNASDILYRYWKDSHKHLSELERRSLYARCFGFPGGDPEARVNDEFNDLWLRFLSAASSYVPQFQLDLVLRGQTAASMSQEQVRKSGRDLGTNLSLYGRGIAFAAIELQAQLREIIALLNDPEIKASYGARDMFQVVARVATLELGGARNSIRYRTTANAGAVIIRWLANRASILTSSSPARLLNDLVIQSRQTSPTKPTLDPTDFDLVNACEQWLVATGAPENTR
jgi:hypothetical protein